MINTTMGGEPERGAPCAFISFSNSNYANKEIRVVRVSDSKTIFYTYADANGNAYLPVFKKGNYKVFDTDKDLFPGLEYRINTNGKVYADSDRYSNKEEKEAIKTKTFSNIILDDWDAVNNLLQVANEPLDPVTETKWKVGDKLTIPITNTTQSSGKQHDVADEYKNAELVLLKIGDSYDVSTTGKKAKLVLGTVKPWELYTYISDGDHNTYPWLLLLDMDIRFYRNLKKVVNRKIVIADDTGYYSNYSVRIYDVETKQQLTSFGQENHVSRISLVNEDLPLFAPSILDISRHSFKSNKEFYLLLDYGDGYQSRNGQYGTYVTELINPSDIPSMKYGLNSYYLLPTTDEEANEFMNEINVSIYKKRGSWMQNSKDIYPYSEEKEQMNLPFELVSADGNVQLKDYGHGSSGSIINYYTYKDHTTNKYVLSAYTGTMPSNIAEIKLMVI